MIIGRIITQVALESSHVSEDAVIRDFETPWIPCEGKSLEISQEYTRICQFGLDNVLLIGCNVSYSDQTSFDGNKTYKTSRELFM
jgi:hypothetical protein